MRRCRNPTNYHVLPGTTPADRVGVHEDDLVTFWAQLVMTYIVVAYTVMAYIFMAYIVMAYIAMAYIVVASIAMAYIVVASTYNCLHSYGLYIVMARVVMTYRYYPADRFGVHKDDLVTFGRDSWGFVTVNVYLNDIRPEDSGRTRFYRDRHGEFIASAGGPLLSMQRSKVYVNSMDRWMSRWEGWKPRALPTGQRFPLFFSQSIFFPQFWQQFCNICDGWILLPLRCLPCDASAVL